MKHKLNYKKTREKINEILFNNNLTAEKIADKIIKLGEIYPVSKEELEGAIKNAK